MKPDRSGYSPSGIAARLVEDIRAASCGGFFPLTPARSLGERVNRSLRGEQARPLGFPPRDARCSLSQGERVRVRGDGANCAPGIVEFEVSSGGAGGFTKRL